MKKLVIAALAASSFIATPALADTTIIWATVPLTCNIDGPPNNGSINLNGTTGLGDVTAQCNSAGGFTVSITSLNGWALADQDNALNATTYPYQLDVDGNLISSNQSFTSAAGDASLINPVTAPVSVVTSGPNGAPFAGTYQDTITWTLTAN